MTLWFHSQGGRANSLQCLDVVTGYKHGFCAGPKSVRKSVQKLFVQALKVVHTPAQRVYVKAYLPAHDRCQQFQDI